jgi:hypothetical protein
MKRLEVLIDGRRSMKTLEVLHVSVVGTVAVGYVRAASGAEGCIAIEPRMARDLETALGLGEHPVVTVESWQLLPTYAMDREPGGWFG